MYIDQLLGFLANPAVVAGALAIALFFAIRTYMMRREKGVLMLALAVGFQLLVEVAIAVLFKQPDWGHRGAIQKMFALSHMAAPVFMILGWALLARSAPNHFPQPTRGAAN